MDELVAADRIKQMLRIYKERQEKINQMIVEVENFINSIEDTEMRQIFEMRFIEGKKLWEIAKEVNQDRSGIGKKINAYLQFSHNSSKSVL